MEASVSQSLLKTETRENFVVVHPFSREKIGTQKCWKPIFESKPDLSTSNITV